MIKVINNMFYKLYNKMPWVAKRNKIIKAIQLYQKAELEFIRNMHNGKV